MFKGPQKKGGGIVFLICQDIKFVPLPDFDWMTTYLEALTIELSLPNNKLLVSSMYRPPNTDDKSFLNEFNDYTLKLKNSGKSYIIGLDHNLNLLNYKRHHSTRKFLELIIEHEQLPCITRPTRITHHSAALLGNILVSKELHSVQHSGIIISNISDHLPCLSVFSNVKGSPKNKAKILICNLSEKKIKKIIAKLESSKFDKCLSYSNLNVAIESFHRTISNCINEISPEKEICVSTNHTHCELWMSKGLRNCSRNSFSYTRGG